LGQVAKPSGNSHPIISPYGVFRASDGDLNIGAATQKMWLKLCDLIGSPELKSDPRFKDNSSRFENRTELKSLIDLRMSVRTREQWTNLLVDAGIPAGPINSMSDVFADTQLAHLALITQVEHIELGKIDQVLTPIHINGKSVVGERKAPPTLGQHTRELLKESGISIDKIEDLIKEQVVFEHSFGK
jgi:crotonobetainyl-CoA:carnitine CoA-transferase CaiB-like acyl-CoA transferase